MSEQKAVRVAHVIGKMCAGGVESVVFNYYRHIDHRKYQFDFYYGSDSTVEPPQELIDMGARFIEIPPYQDILRYLKTLEKHFHENRYKIVHSHMNSLNIFPLYAAKRAGVPNRICHSHSTAAKGETKKNIIKNALRPFSRVYPTCLFACSEKAGKWLYGKHSEFEIINNAIDLEKFSFQQTIRDEVRKELGVEGKFVVGHLGRFCYQKNHDFLISIFEEIHRRREDAVLIMAGEGELEPSIRKKVEQLGLSNCVKFLGVRRDAPRLYQAMDVFLLPSRYEGLPVVGVEAQAAGLPLITTDMVTKETKILDSARFLNSAESVSQWADAVIDSATQYERHDTSQEMKTAGFDIERESQKLMQKYDSLLIGKYL